MNKRFAIFSVLLISSILIAACSSPQPEVEVPAVVVEEAPTEEMDAPVDTEIVIEEEPAPATSDYPAWYSAALTDVNTGQVFSIQENIGKVYLVETMAVWCPVCLDQQNEVKRFHDLLGERDDVESLVINIDPNEDTALLTGYTQQNGFDWLYVVASNEMIDEISLLYGSQFLNPPSAPMLIIDRNGDPHPLGFGVKSAEELLEAITPFL